MALSSNAVGSRITMLCTLALKEAMAKLGTQYENETGDRLLITYGSTRALFNRIDKGEAADVVIVTNAALADLLKQGKVVEPGHADVARSGIGVAIRYGGPCPDISTRDAFKRSLLAAKSVASRTRPMAVPAEFILGSSSTDWVSLNNSGQRLSLCQGGARRACLSLPVRPRLRCK